MRFCGGGVVSAFFEGDALLMFLVVFCCEAGEIPVKKGNNNCFTFGTSPIYYRRE